MVNMKDFGFNADPFPLVPQASVHHWAGRADVRSQLLDIIETVRVTDVGTSEFAILYGEYGAGKSHALRYLTTQINEVRANDFKSKAVYVPSIRIDQKVTFQGLYHSIIEELGLDYLRSLGEEVSSKLNAAGKALEASLPKEEALELVRANAVVPRVIDGLPKEDRASIRLLQLLAQGNQDAVRFLHGEGKGLPDIGYANPIDTDFQATKVLSGLFRALTREIGGQSPAWLASYLFLDEFEAVMDIKPGESAPLLNAFRELINQLPYNFCLICSFTADTALIEAIIPQAVLQRMTRGYVELPPLAPDEARTFLASHFESYRPDAFVAPSPFYPFEDASIDVVLEQIVEMTPRNMFRKFRSVLERAIKRHDLKAGETIPPSLAEEILSAS